MNDELPQGWATARLEEVVTKQKGKKPAVLRDTPAAGFLPYLDIRAIEKNHIREFAEVKSSKIATKDDLFVVWDGARSGWVGGGITGAIGSTIMSLTPQRIESVYLRHFIASQFQTLNTNTRGTGIPHVDPQVFWNLEIPLAPLGEQRRIVAKLTELLRKVDACQQRLAKIPVLLKHFRQSVLAAACSGRLTADWREENPEMNAIVLVADDDLPSPWMSCVLKDVATVVSGFAFSSGDFTDAGVPAIKISNVQYGEFVEKNQEYLPESFLKRHPAFVVSPQTLLMALTRPITNDTLKVCLYPKEAKPGLLNQRVCKFEPSAKIHRDYLHLFMQTRPFKFQVQENLSETLQPNLSPKALDSFSVALPPLTEQQEIVRRVEGLFALADQIESRLAKAQAQVDKLTPSLLARAFRGHLVPQDPTDEPAEKLLNWTRAEKK